VARLFSRHPLKNSHESVATAVPSISAQDPEEETSEFPSTQARERVEWRDIGAVLQDVAEDFATQELLPPDPGDDPDLQPSDAELFTADGLKRELRAMIRDSKTPIRERRQAISDLARICGLDSFRGDLDIQRMTNRELAEAFRDRVLPVLQMFGVVQAVAKSRNSLIAEDFPTIQSRSDDDDGTESDGMGD
jgi:hypothetical protein